MSRLQLPTRAALPFLFVACAGTSGSPPAPAATPTHAPSRAALPAALPANWAHASITDFGLAFESWKLDGPHPIARTARAELQRALGEQDALSVRAVLLLAYVAGGHLDLIEHLEKRVPASSRALDASGVLAAAALSGEQRARIPARLTTLAMRGTPHPDIEVRVECARAALASGNTDVIPFLLTVLRVGTHDEQLDPPDWAASSTLAWIKSRAAEALSYRAGVSVAFRPDGSFEHQEQEARRLAGLLLSND